MGNGWCAIHHQSATLNIPNSHLHVALERAIHATKSFVIALALVKRRLNVDQASDAAGVEVNSQIERWGEVEDSKFDHTTSNHTFV